MDIILVEKREIKLPSGAVVSYPAGWSGAVPDEYGAAWVAEGAAQYTGVEIPPALTPQQTQVLAAVANEIIEEATGVAPMQKIGELTEDEQTTAFTLDDLTFDELLAVAAEVGVTVPAKVRKAADRAALVALLPAGAVAGGQPERQS